jgi:hypothetical protein
MVRYQARNSPGDGWKRGEMTMLSTLKTCNLRRPQNLDPKQGDSVAILPVFIQSL